MTGAEHGTVTSTKISTDDGDFGRMFLGRWRRTSVTLVKVGVDYCTTHDGIRNEDELYCDFRPTHWYKPEDRPESCVLVPLYMVGK